MKPDTCVVVIVIQTRVCVVYPRVSMLHHHHHHHHHHNHHHCPPRFSVCVSWMPALVLKRGQQLFLMNGDIFCRW